MGASSNSETATLAGGCFWGMEDLVRRLNGVIDTEVGYTGGTEPNATYRTVKTGKTGHAEALKITFDPSKITYAEILDFFFRMHDPTTLNRQGNDLGSQYRSAIFFHSPEQKRVAEEMKNLVDKAGIWPKPVVTEVVPAGAFWDAEPEHQDYLENTPGGYTCHYIRKLPSVLPSKNT